MAWHIPAPAGQGKPEKDGKGIFLHFRAIPSRDPGCRESWTGPALAKAKTRTGFQPGSGMELGKRENPEQILDRVRNGAGKRGNPDQILARVRNGVGKSENLDGILAGVQNGLGKRKNPDRILAGVRNGVGKSKNCGELCCLHELENATGDRHSCPFSESAGPFQVPHPPGESDKGGNPASPTTTHTSWCVQPGRK